MPDPIFNKLSAYLDGELNQREQMEVEVHLQTCAACREELEDLRRLASLLQESPEPEFTPPLDFKAQLMLQLPRRDDPQPSSSNLPWVAPTLVLTAWIFIQVTLGLSTLFLLVSQAGILDGAAVWASDAPRQMLWFITIQSTVGNSLGSEGQAVINILNDTGLFTQNLVILLLWQVGLAVFYWGTLTLVWHNRVKTMWASFTMG